MLHKIFKIILFLSIFLVGFFAGGYFMRDIQPRSYLSTKPCEKCLVSNEVAGLLASVGINNAPELIPEVVMETDEAIAVKHPFPQANIHLVVFPKKDIKDISDITEEDSKYALGAFSVIGELARRNHLEDYRVITNGPGYQSVRYLHFHLLSK